MPRAGETMRGKQLAVCCVVFCSGNCGKPLQRDQQPGAWGKGEPGGDLPDGSRGEPMGPRPDHARERFVLACSRS